MWNGTHMPDGYQTNALGGLAGEAMTTAIDSASVNAINSNLTTNGTSGTTSYVDELEERITKLEALVDKLVTEFMPEHKI